MVAAIPQDVLDQAKSDASGELKDWKTVYDEFIRVKKQCNEPTDGLTFEKFQQTLKKNRDALMQRHGCKRVKFSVYVKEGRASLKATPVAPNMPGVEIHAHLIEQVLAEVQAWHTRGTSHVFFADDNFIGNRAYAKDLLRALAKWNDSRRQALSFYTMEQRADSVGVNTAYALLRLILDAWTAQPRP